MKQYTIGDIRFLAEEYMKSGIATEEKYPERSIGKTLQYISNCLMVTANALEQEENS